MPRKKIAGTFEGKPTYRWTRMVRGVRWRLLCRARKPDEADKPNTGYLDLPECDWTAARSLDAANAWWEARQYQLDNPDSAKPFIEKMQKVKRISDKMGLPKGECVPDEVNAIRWQIAKNVDAIPDDNPTGKTVLFWAENYFAHKLPKDRGFARFDNLKRNVLKLANHVGKDSPITAIDWNAWDTFNLTIKNSTMAPTTQRDVVSDCRAFIRHLERRDIIPPVKNLAESQKKRITAQQIEHFSREELREMLSKSEGYLRLFFFLFVCRSTPQRPTVNHLHG